MDDKTFDQKNAEDWIGSVENSPSRDKDIYPWLKDWADRIGAYDILDIGCGQGICSEKIELIERRYTGVEPSVFLIDRARQLYTDGNRQFVQGNIYQLPFEDGAFDAAFSIAVWHLLEHLKKGATELSRVLKPGGHFLIVSANPGAYHKWTDRYANGKTEGRRFEGTMVLPDKSVLQDILYLHSLDELMQTLHAAHLVVRKSETFRSEQYIWIEGQKATVS